MNASEIGSAVAVLVSVPGVIAVMTRIRSLRLVSGPWATALAVVIGFTLNIAAWYTHVAHAGASFEQVMWTGIIVGLGAAGIYDASTATDRRIEDEALRHSSKSKPLSAKS